MIIILTVVLGGLVGWLFFPPEWLAYTDSVMDIGLCLLLLLVGIDIGKQKGIMKEIKALGWSLLIVPLLIGFGSIVGGMVIAAFIHIPINEGGAIGAGFGWYSLSAVILADYSNELSALAFLTNVVREILAIACIPFVAKYIGYIPSIVPAGATAMDTTLPIITRYTDGKTAVLAFVSGVILSGLVPILVPLLMQLNL